MAKNLVIVESPAKAKTLKKFLGSNYKIEASMGHVRDLPKSEMGVDFDNDYEPKYITIRGKGELLAKLRKEVKKADKIYLATDPDREGEAISWHLAHSLKLEGKAVYRITFNEITKQAVKNSIKEAREVDMNLVDAQQARRTLDRVVGYKISPLLWAKVKKGLSAGRVQSVALKIICDREDEIENFLPEEYWSIDFDLKFNKSIFKGHFLSLNGEKIALDNKEIVDNVVSKLDEKNLVVTEVKKSKRAKKPYPPFTTSTLQQEASKALGFSTSKTMQIAQELYEGVDIKGSGTVGLVSYIRTDSVRISDEAYEACNTYITSTFGEQFLPETRNEYKTRSRAQDAHEAIRPTDVNFVPKEIIGSLSKDQFKLYSLIWNRFLASQMSVADYDTIKINIQSGEVIIRSSGSILVHEGFLAVYKTEEEKNDKDVKMPNLEVGDKIILEETKKEQHFTQPPARYSEASLVKKLEEVGIGRPSTYAPTISTIINRNYITKEQKQLFPTELGEIINEILVNNFSDVVDVEFTAKMEERLDKVELGELEWKEILRNFYPEFKVELEKAEEAIAKIEIKDEVTDVICEKCGEHMVIKYGKFGKFLACPAFPNCNNTKPFFEDAGVDCPLCKGKIIIKKSKKGRRFYGCENNPECEFISWYKPTGEKCPKCSSILVEKGKKEKRIVCENEKCDYFLVVTEEENLEND